MATTIRQWINDLSLRLATRFMILRNKEGITTVEVLLILGVATIILGSTYFGLKDTIPTWWDKYIKPQFPQT